MLTLNVKKFEEAWFGVAVSGSEIYATAFAFSRLRVMQSLLRNIPFYMPFQYTENMSASTGQVITLLFDIYSGKEVSKDIPLVLDHLTPYTKKVLETVASIPIGYVTSYGSVANVAGGSPRAVGNTLASNPFPLLIPCHRVVASNFSLGGYSQGLRAKWEILGREKRGYIESLQIKLKNGRLHVFPVELVLNKPDETYVKISNSK